MCVQSELRRRAKITLLNQHEGTSIMAAAEGQTRGRLHLLIYEGWENRPSIKRWNMFKTGNLVGADLIQAPFEAFRRRRGPPGRNCGSQQTPRQQKPISRWPMKPRNLPTCCTGLARPGARLQRGAVKRWPPTEAQRFSVIKLTLNTLWRTFAHQRAPRWVSREGEPQEPWLTGRESTGWRRCISKPPHLELHWTRVSRDISQTSLLNIAIDMSWISQYQISNITISDIKYHNIRYDQISWDHLLSNITISEITIYFNILYY